MMDSLKEVNKKIRLMEMRTYAKKWRQSNPELKKKQNREWNSMYRNEYQREYRKRNKRTS